jgi:alkaline phosphatase D
MADRAVIWSRSDIPARMIVEYSTTESFQNARRVVGPAAIESTDFTTRVDLAEPPTGQKIFYRVTFQSPDDAKVFSETATGGFLTALNTKRDVSIAFGGDVCGQGSIPYSAELRFTRRCGACAPISSCIPAMRFTPTTESSRRN